MKLQIKNWSSFQHYKKRRPPWIKLHRTLLDEPEFMRLQVASRALAPCIWLLASESDSGILEMSIKDIAWRLRISESEISAGLSGLIASGYIIPCDDASKALAICTQDSLPETETETEETTSRPAAGTDEPAQTTFKPRRATTDGVIFAWMQREQDDGFINGLGLSCKDAARAGKMLKGNGHTWSPHKLAALHWALQQQPTPKDPIAMARGHMTGKTGQLPEFERLVEHYADRIKFWNIEAEKQGYERDAS